MSFLREQSNYKFKLSALSLQTHSLETYIYSIKSLISPKIRKCFQNFLKRMSSVIFKSEIGSVTVEASLAAPIFLICFTMLLSLIDIFRFQINLDYATSSIAKELAVYTSVDEQTLISSDTQYVSSIFNDAYTAIRIHSILGDEYLKLAPISSINYANKLEGDYINVIVKYKTKPYFTIPGIFHFGVQSNAYAHKFNGYDNTRGVQLSDLDTFVYITPTGTVFHSTTHCNYLDLSIQAIEKSSLVHIRNKNGGKYLSCSICGNVSNPMNYFITDYGTSYHTDRLCSGLKRTVEMVARSEVSDRAPCSKCGCE